jgi:hypothetical protein
MTGDIGDLPILTIPAILAILAIYLPPSRSSPENIDLADSSPVIPLQNRPLQPPSVLLLPPLAISSQTIAIK